MIGQLGRIFTQNRFAYCIGNPIMMIDYTGKCTCPNGHLQGDFHHYCGDVVLPFADIQGHQLLDLWMNGSVDGELVCDSPEWSEYMTSNTWDITSEIIVEAAHFGEDYSMDPQDFGKKCVSYNGWVSLTNGYWPKATNYLHTGNLTMNGWVKYDISNGNYTYDIQCEWIDRIDPNPHYFMDSFLAWISNLFSGGKPKDYDIRIKWHMISSY